MITLNRIAHFLLACFFLSSFNQEAVAGEDVKITAKAVEDTVRVGKEARLLFEMKPNAGLHLNVVPAITLELIDAKNFTLVAKKFTPDSTSKTLTTKDGYEIFDPHHAQPVSFAVKVEKGAKPGRYPLKAKLTYYYCSDAEGWCRFTHEEFVINLVVVK
ncbi:hypothetical protein L0337_35710 [candidate division KSB1 bacterium]|nr:hypothetical protein [candidate division KSB1 bacterium]